MWRVRLNRGWTRRFKGLAATADQLCLFAHYDPHGRLAPYTRHYLEALRALGVDIVLISTNLGEAGIRSALEICHEVIVRPNRGHDFGSWKVGLKCYGRPLRTGPWQRLILANDSVFAPLFPLEEMFVAMSARGMDFWGVTDSYEVAWHLQSYFLVFESTALRHHAFWRFWRRCRHFDDKWTLITTCEVGLSQHLVEFGLHGAAYCSADRLVNGEPVNMTLAKWEALLENRCPMLKVMLLRDNPFGVDLSGWRERLAATGYNLALIDDYLESCRA